MFLQHIINEANKYIVLLKCYNVFLSDDKIIYIYDIKKYLEERGCDNIVWDLNHAFKIYNEKVVNYWSNQNA